MSLRENLDTSTSIGRMIRTVLSAVAEFERDLGMERTSAAIGSRAKSGKPWGEPGYGYRKGATVTGLSARRGQVGRAGVRRLCRAGFTYSGVARRSTSKAPPPPQ